MKICVLNHDLMEYTGAGRFALDLIQHLAAADPAVEVVAMTAVGSGRAGEVPVIRPERSRLLRAIPAIRRIFSGCDIVHALDGYPFGVVAALANFGLGKKLVITAIGTGALKPLSRPLAGRLLRWAYRRADAVTAVSNYTRAELLKTMPDLTIAVIHHGVNPGEFSGDALAALDAGERARIENLRPYILSVGALKPRKGYRDSLAVFSRLRPQYPSLRYVIVGGGDAAGLEQEIDRLNLRPAVVWFKYVSRPFLRALYQHAELFVLLPYDDRRDVEGFGLVFLEAAAAGVPVIGTRESGAADAVSDGFNGYLVEPHDVPGAAKAAERILSTPELHAKLAQGSRSFAQAMSWSRAAEAYLTLYRALLAR